MELKTFNLLVLMELNRYSPKLRHLGTGYEELSLLRAALLSYVKTDLEHDGLYTTVERWRRFIGMPKPKPLNLPPSPTLGVQISLKGAASGGRQIKLL